MDDYNTPQDIQADTQTGLELNDLDINDTNIRINPNFYIHVALLRAQSTLSNTGNLQDNIINYFVMVEHIEALSKAARHVTQEYDDKIKAYLESEDYTKTADGRLKLAKLANKKLNELTSAFFQSTPLKQSLKYTIPRKRVLREFNETNENEQEKNINDDEDGAVNND